jgi:16S rRNA (guanine527-N7)-methyltransferase
LDLGSGAGFPGLVLAILGRAEGDAEVHLVEADHKKAEFLREAARIVDSPVTLHVERIESIAPFSIDAVTARACAPLPRLLDYAAPFLRHYRPGAPPPVGLFLKGKDVDRELTATREKWKIQVELLPSRTDAAAKVLRIQLPHPGGDLL